MLVDSYRVISAAKRWNEESISVHMCLQVYDAYIYTLFAVIYTYIHCIYSVSGGTYTHSCVVLVLDRGRSAGVCSGVSQFCHHSLYCGGQDIAGENIYIAGLS